jgi:hypothetical protein
MALATERLNQCYDLFLVMRNEKVLRRGSTGEAVRLIQQCLISMGYPLPLTVAKYGSPDGIYGNETVQAIRRFQIQCKLAVDGKIGPQTLKTIDAAMVTVDINLPPIKSRIPISRGTGVEAIEQEEMACWATSYAIMANWKKLSSMSPRDHMKALGPKWLAYFDAKKGLPLNEHIPFANACGLRFEPFVSVSAEDLAQLLFAHGPLLVCYGWRSLAERSTPGKQGFHAVVLWAITGDGTPDGTTLDYVDPQKGTDKSVSFAKFLDMYELGYLLRAEKNQPLNNYTQILHF